jgi:hypothetical protein
MPSLSIHAPFHARSETSATNPMSAHTVRSHNMTKTVAIVIIGILILLAIGSWVYYRGLTWFRTCREANAVREKAIVDRKAWFRSTRPVVRRPITPRMLDAYSRSPHIQREHEVAIDLEVGSAHVHGPSRLHHSIDITRSSSQIAAGISTPLTPLFLKPFEVFKAYIARA